MGTIRSSVVALQPLRMAGTVAGHDDWDYSGFVQGESAARPVWNSQ